MDQETSHQISRLLSEMAAGDQNAASRLMPLVYPELKRLANRYMRRERTGHTLQPTALVHEAYIKIVGQPADIAWNGRTHFFAVAAQAMRRILIDHARTKQAEKRGGKQVPLSLEDGLAVSHQTPEDLIALDQALTRLEKIDPSLSRIVELRYFGGLTDAGVAEVLDVSERTVKRRWSSARLWLHRELSRRGPAAH